MFYSESERDHHLEQHLLRERMRNRPRARNSISIEMTPSDAMVGDSHDLNHDAQDVAAGKEDALTHDSGHDVDQEVGVTENGVYFLSIRL